MIFKWIRKHILFTTLILIELSVFSNYVLGLFNLRYRFFVIQIFCLLAFAGIMAGIIQGIRKLNEKKTRLACYIALFVTTFALMVVGFLPLVFFFGATSEKATYLYGDKYSALKSDFIDVTIDYYEYKNFLVSGTEIKYDDFFPVSVNDEPIRSRHYPDGTSEVILGQGG